MYPGVHQAAWRRLQCPYHAHVDARTPCVPSTITVAVWALARGSSHCCADRRCPGTSCAHMHACGIPTVPTASRPRLWCALVAMADGGSIIFQWLDRIGTWSQRLDRPGRHPCVCVGHVAWPGSLPVRVLRARGHLLSVSVVLVSVAVWQCAGLGYSIPQFQAYGINSPQALMSLTFEDYDAGAWRVRLPRLACRAVLTALACVQLVSLSCTTASGCLS